MPGVFSRALSISQAQAGHHMLPIDRLIVSDSPAGVRRRSAAVSCLPLFAAIRSRSDSPAGMIPAAMHSLKRSLALKLCGSLDPEDAIRTAKTCLQPRQQKAYVFSPYAAVTRPRLNDRPHRSHDPCGSEFDERPSSGIRGYTGRKKKYNDIIPGHLKILRKPPRASGPPLL